MFPATILGLCVFMSLLSNVTSQDSCGFKSEGKKETECLCYPGIKKMLCTNQRLSEIPILPSGYIYVDLSNNLIEFVNLTRLMLFSSVILSDNPLNCSQSLPCKIKSHCVCSNYGFGQTTKQTWSMPSSKRTISTTSDLDKTTVYNIKTLGSAISRPIYSSSPSPSPQKTSQKWMTTFGVLEETTVPWSVRNNGFSKFTRGFPDLLFEDNFTVSATEAILEESFWFNKSSNQTSQYIWCLNKSNIIIILVCLLLFGMFILAMFIVILCQKKKTRNWTAPSENIEMTDFYDRCERIQVIDE
jgi:hypothetical protein